MSRILWPTALLLLAACAGDSKETDTDLVDTEIQDTEIEDTEVVDTEVEDTEVQDTDAPGDRDPGPHADEYGQTVAWLQLPDSLVSTESALCTDTTGDWAQLFGAPPFPGNFNYAFLRVDDATSATAMRCASGEYPDACTERDFTYDVTGSTLVTSSETATVIFNTCELVVVNTTTIVDQGAVGQETVSVEILYRGDCFGNAVNDGCIIDHDFDVEWNF
jgi:hypothetical protein